MSHPKKRRLTLQLKVTLLLAAAIFVTSSVVVSLSAFTMANEAKILVEHESNVVSGLLAENSAGAIRFGKTEALESSFDRILRESTGDLQQVVAFNKQGEVLFTLPAMEVAASLSVGAREVIANGAAEYNADQMIHTTPVLFGKNNDTVGAIALLWSQDEIMETVISEVVTNVLFTVPVGLLITLGIYSLMGKILFKPLRDLEQVAAGVTRGQVPEGPMLKRDDVIGDAVRALYHLGTTIRDSADAAGQFGRGDLSADIKPGSEHDRLATELHQMFGRLREVLAAAPEGRPRSS